MKNINKSRERLVGEDKKDSSILFNRHLAAYLFSRSYVKNKKILEIGCSDGYGSFILAKKAKIVIAMDVDNKTILSARKKYNLKNLNFLNTDALSLSYKNEFDVVISFQVIEHVIDVDLYLTNIKDALKKNGIFILSTPNRLLRLYKGQKPWNKFHVKEYEADELRNLLRNYFSDIKILGLHATSEIYHLEKKRLYLRRLIARIDLFGLYEKLPRELADSFLGIIRKILRRGKKNNIGASMKDFWVDDKNLNNSLDIIAICKN